MDCMDDDETAKKLRKKALSAGNSLSFLKGVIMLKLKCKTGQTFLYFNQMSTLMYGKQRLYLLKIRVVLKSCFPDG